MTTMSPDTRRPRKRAAEAPGYRTGWASKAACNGQDLDDFFSEMGTAQNRARVHCRRCPVLETCLREAMSLEDGFRYGVYAGLNGEQRRALPWEVALHGQPDIARAQLLVSDRFEYLLKDLRHVTPDSAVAVLRGRDVHVDGPTVRLAMWWMGYKAARVPERTAFDPVPEEPQRVIRLSADVIRRLRAMGASYPDVASYLGAAQAHIAKAIPMIEAQDDKALRAEMAKELAA